MMNLMNRQRCQVLTMLAFFIMGKAGEQALGTDNMDLETASCVWKRHIVWVGVQMAM